MTDWSRLVDYVIDYFPEPDRYSREDVSKWIDDNVNARKSGAMSDKEKKKILNDWDTAVMEGDEEYGEIRDFIEGRARRFLDKIKRFLGRLF